MPTCHRVTSVVNDTHQFHRGQTRQIQLLLHMHRGPLGTRLSTHLHEQDIGRRKHTRLLNVHCAPLAPCTFNGIPRILLRATGSIVQLGRRDRFVPNYVGRYPPHTVIPVPRSNDTLGASGAAPPGLAHEAKNPFALCRDRVINFYTRPRSRPTRLALNIPDLVQKAVDKLHCIVLSTVAQRLRKRLVQQGKPLRQDRSGCMACFD